MCGKFFCGQPRIHLGILHIGRGVAGTWESQGKANLIVCVCAPVHTHCNCCCKVVSFSLDVGAGIAQQHLPAGALLSQLLQSLYELTTSSELNFPVSFLLSKIRFVLFCTVRIKTIPPEQGNMNVNVNYSLTFKDQNGRPHM